MSAAPTPPPDDDLISRQLVADLRDRAQAGWDGIADGVLDRVRATARSGRLLSLGTPAEHRLGDLTVREHALRAVLARALRGDAHRPSAVDLDIDGGQLTGVRVGLHGSEPTDLDALVARVRRLVLDVVRDVLGEARHAVLTQSVDVSVRRTDTPPDEEDSR
ncbi:hypothetical protein [Williamsia herbipolensis]|uniref:hypothetical protein n=1 Tax=Williamsia herbipolensis TaxID=1603258 RepID=UPI0005F849B4|nr:hypothetical protein [Williamsia herbipolensis]